jgi:hypothetical protein
LAASSEVGGGVLQPLHQVGGTGEQNPSSMASRHAAGQPSLSASAASATQTRLTVRSRSSARSSFDAGGVARIARRHAAPLGCTVARTGAAASARP